MPCVRSSFRFPALAINGMIDYYQDWFHESCCNLRERPELSLEKGPEEAAETLDALDDGISEASSSDLPPPLISGPEYEAFVCGTCASQNETLVRWAGTPGITIIVRDSPDRPWKCLGDGDQSSDDLAVVAAGVKRPLSPSDASVPDAKRFCGVSTTSAPGPCLAPPPNYIAQTIFASIRAPTEPSLGLGDLFLSENFRNRWCHCAVVSFSTICQCFI